MPDYRRNRVPGGTYFFTANLLDRRSGLLVTHIAALRSAVQGTRTRAPFHIDAWVVLPDHMHCVWTLPAGDGDYSGRWQALKKAFTKSIPATEQRSMVQARRGERGIWQRRFWEHTLSGMTGTTRTTWITSTSTQSSTRLTRIRRIGRSRRFGIA